MQRRPCGSDALTSSRCAFMGDIVTAPGRNRQGRLASVFDPERVQEK